MVNGIKFIENVINDHDWIIGGKNFDEDLHFSSFYLRQSSSKYLNKKSKIGYNTIIALYEDFNETYYIPRSECNRVASYLLNRIINRPEWMNKINDVIYRLCDNLSNVFSVYNINDDFAELSNEELMKLYKKHNLAHWKLYQVARIPEALDRGEELFTNHLKIYLRDKCKITELQELNQLFYKLTMPEKPTIFQQETFELLNIINDIEKRPSQRKLFQNQDRRLMLKAAPRILKKINVHKNKWGFIDYHGYGRRNIPRLDLYIAKICKHFSQPTTKVLNKKKYSDWLITNLNQKIALFKRYHIDENYQKVFTLYGDIGLLKLYRRFIQLKNFYFLDRLIQQIALREGCEEGIIRSLFPEEVEKLIEGNLKIDQDIRNRFDFIVYMIHGSDEKLYSGLKYKQMKDKLDSKLKQQVPTSNELYGTPVSMGFIEGTCKIIIRPQDAENKSFKEGEILISEATDPDLIELLKIAGGVVTQQGGVTSHASILCRELGKPALIGVANLLDSLKDGDRVILDGYNGKLTIIKKKMKYQFIIKDKSDSLDPYLRDKIGNKAHNLFRLQQAGFTVPTFFVISTSNLFSSANDGKLIIDDFMVNYEILEEIKIACNEFRSKKVAIRSSFLVEDDKYNSKAGYFPTIINIEKYNVAESFSDYIRELLIRFKKMPEGGIIIQEMVQSDISGICFTVSPVTLDENTMLIEIVKGPNFGLTGGRQNPDLRLKIDKNSNDVISMEKFSTEVFFAGKQIRDMVKILIEIERYFNYPQDVEWAICGDKFFVLQSRPITTIH